MYTVVEFDGERIVWNDGKICTSETSANNRMNFMKQKNPRKEYEVIKLTKFKRCS